MLLSEPHEPSKRASKREAESRITFISESASKRPMRDMLERFSVAAAALRLAFSVTQRARSNITYGLEKTEAKILLNREAAERKRLDPLLQEALK